MRPRLMSFCCSALAACASTSSRAPPVADDAVLASIGLDVAAHHLALDPRRECRVRWRPAGMRIHEQMRRPTAAEVRDSARAYLGVRYVYGGLGADGLDCSGFVNRVFAAHGYDLPRTSRDLFRVGLRVERGALAAGDLLFFTSRPGGATISHVAIYLGGGRMIHAVKGRGRVSTDDLARPYYAERYAGARRVLALPPGRYSNVSGGAVAGVDFRSQREIGERFAGRLGPCREFSWAGLVAARR